jgi:hypothetical protein
LVTIYHIVQCHITEDIIHFHDIFTLQLAWYKHATSLLGYVSQ